MLALLVNLASAEPPEPTGGVYVGQYVTFDPNALSNAFEGMGRLGIRVARPFDLEAEVAFGEGHTLTNFDYLYSRWTGRVATVFHFTPEQRVDLFFSVGGGLQWVDVHRAADAPDAGDKGLQLYRNPSSDFLLHAGPGMTIWLAGPLHVRADVRYLGSFGGDPTQDTTDVFHNVEWTFGLDFRPERPPDSDGDGIANNKDACRDEPEDKDGYEDEDGCPDLDDDKDGIEDTDDKCPDHPEDKDGFEDRDGCPDKDNDADGLADKKDACPDDAEDYDDYQDDDGCPETEDDDTDGDGIGDARDKCPDEPETDNGYHDKDGCPDEIPVEVARFTGVIEGITFETNKAVIRRSSETVLYEALGVLNQFPDLMMEINGHTDDVGDDRHNLELSQARAESVMAWFILNGVNPHRLRAVGFGELQPLAENSTDAGRAENRRVEFHPIED